MLLKLACEERGRSGEAQELLEGIEARAIVRSFEQREALKVRAARNSWMTRIQAVAVDCWPNHMDLRVSRRRG